MSRILFLADLHGNMPATLALEKELEKIKPDDIWFLGDAVGKGPESDKTLDWVRSHCNHFISGNWDLCCVETGKLSENDSSTYDADHLEWLKMNLFYVEQLGKERLDWLESLPQEDEVLISGINFRLIHGRPIAANFHPYLSLDEMRPGYTDTKGKLHGGFIVGSAGLHLCRSPCNSTGLHVFSVLIGEDWRNNMQIHLSPWLVVSKVWSDWSAAIFFLILCLPNSPNNGIYDRVE